MFDKLKNLFNKSPSTASETSNWQPPTAMPAAPSPQVSEAVAAPTKIKKARKVRAPRAKKDLQITRSEKDKATEAGEPWVGILSVDIDPTNINAGGFTLDWNDKFVINLIKSGYKQKETDTDQVIVDRWFQTVCRNIALEVYEQQVADPVNRDMEDVRRIYTKDIGDGRSEVS